MGCFDCTCAFSRTAISSGDEILLVALNPKTKAERSTYGLMGASSKNFRFIGVGEYDEYGSIDGFDNEVKGVKGNWWNYQFMVHRSVAEGLLGKPLESYTSLENAVKGLLDIAHAARIQVMGNDLLGEQWCDRDEIALQRRVLALTAEILDRKDKELAEIEAEFEEDDERLDG